MLSPPPGPLLLGAPGEIVTILVPIERICPVIALLAPLPSESSATTEATPMITPSMVSSERTRLASRLSSATRATSPTLTPPL